jgi:hypothetical protein
VPFGERPLAELGRVGLPDDHRTGLAQPADHRGIRFGVGKVARAAERGRLPGEIGVVLHRDRHAQQRRLLARGDPFISGGRLGERGLPAQPPERVQARLGLLDPVESLGDDLDRARTTGSDQLSGPLQAHELRHDASTEICLG